MENYGWRRLYIVRKDLNLSAGKLAAQLSHCSEAYWLRLIQRELFVTEEAGYADLILDKDMVNGYILGRIVKTICSAKNLKDLLKAKQMAEEMGLKEDEDFGLINDACFTELNPENENGSTTTAIWFAPLPDEKAHLISKHYQLYNDENSPRKAIRFDSYQSYICPKCKHAIGRFEDFEMLKSNVNYCNICGQKIDWNLQEEAT